MSRIQKLLKKVESERVEAALASARDGVGEMSIEEIKRKILEKVQKEKTDSTGKEKAALSILSGKLGITTVESQATDVTISAQNGVADAKVDNGPATEEPKKDDQPQIKAQEEEIARCLEHIKCAEESIKELQENIKVKEVQLVNANTDRKNLEIINSENSERIARYEEEISELETRLVVVSEDLEDKRCKLEKAEALYGELKIALDNTSRENNAKISALEDEKYRVEEKLTRAIVDLEDTRKLFMERERSLNDSEASNRELGSRLASTEEEKRSASLQISRLTEELDEKKKSHDELLRLNREIDDIAKESSFKLHAAEREKKEMEDRIAALSEELNTWVKRYESERVAAQEERNRSRSDLEAAKRLIREKERNEFDLQEAFSQVSSSLDLRDKKIEADTKYYEKLLKEMNELRQQLKSLNARNSYPAI